MARRNSLANAVQGIESLSEYDIQVMVFKWAELNSVGHPELLYMYSTASGVRMSVGLLMKCKRMGIIKKGLPDIVLPSARGGYHGLYIELKKHGGKTSPEQIDYINFLKKGGYRADVCTGFDETILCISDYLRGLR